MGREAPLSGFHAHSGLMNTSATPVSLLIASHVGEDTDGVETDGFCFSADKRSN